jgi:8-oxo-dGTP pyrophosphatase MutT (NUDIX family)
LNEIRPAATVIVARDRPGGFEVYMLRRSARSAFVPDAYVFPGGRIDATDSSPEILARVVGQALPSPAAVCAAARETFEEAGLLFAREPLDPSALAHARERLLAGEQMFADSLAALDARIDATQLHYFSHWITPPGEPRRFDTRFFVARAPAGQIAAADAQETVAGEWIAPREALARHAAGAFPMIFPTIKHLERIANFATVEGLFAFTAVKQTVAVMPEMRAGPVFVLPPGIENAW